MLSKVTSLNAMQIEISFAAVYDFNQYTQYVPCPSPSQSHRFWPLPRPAPHCGEGGISRPDPPRKNDQNRVEVAGQNKGPYLNFLQKRKLMMEQYHNTEHEWTMPNPAYQ